jgi:4a-hydroxytetrahydrobiopterin dehydratase
LKSHCFKSYRFNSCRITVYKTRPEKLLEKQLGEIAMSDARPDAKPDAKPEMLAQQVCIPCSGSLPPATATEMAQFHRQIPDWNLIESDGISQLQRQYLFPNFQQALDFTCQVGAAAEVEGHHPALLTEWGKVTVTWWTHAIAGLHHNDFVMAAKTDEMFAAIR